jgi:RimJ/RimL family protein N-acetyltransferase
MIPIETDRLTLRSFCPDDWRELLELAVDYQASEYARYDHKWPTDEQGVKGMADWFSSPPPEGARDRFVAVCLAEAGKLIGMISVNPKQPGVEYGFGYVFHTGYQGQGYATEACRAMLDHAFVSLGAQRITTGTAAANRPSCHLLHRLGFRVADRKMGALRETEDGQTIEVETLGFKLTRKEWAESHA